MRGGPDPARHVGPGPLEKGGQTPGRSRDPPRGCLGTGAPLLSSPLGGQGRGREGRGSNSPEAVDTGLLPESPGAGNICV